MHVPEEPRWVEVAVRRRKNASGSKDSKSTIAGKENVAVVTLLLADHTGAIHCDLWRRVAEEKIKLCQECLDNSEEPVLVRIERFVVVAERRSFECPMQRLHSVESTTLTRLDISTQDSVINSSLTVPTSLYISNFTCLSQPAPFCTNLFGVVTSVEIETISQSDNPMRAFMLQDASGKSLRCVALARHVDNQALVIGNEVVLFFSTALAGLGGNAGQMWVYDDCHIVHMRAGCFVPPSRGEMYIT